MTRATTEDIVVLEKRFTKVIAFISEEVSHAVAKLKSALLGKFLGCGFSLDVVQKKIKIRWNLSGDLHISPLSEGILVFRFSSEEKNRVFDKGPWSLAGQVLALEHWRSSFRPRRDSIIKARFWVWLLDLPLEL